jgi:hypothetical protein
MALRAFNLLVRASERILRLHMIEFRSRLPICHGVAVRAVGANLAAVLIRVAAHAILR